jgi:sulfofructose kinase
VEQGLAAALAAGAEVAVVTQDDQPMWWQRRGETLRCLPSFVVQPVVDTTAAGDTFHGTLAVALGEGAADEEALRFAAAAAALKCLQPGGVAGAPRRPQVQALLSSAR